jgi:hypothetical protein
MPKRTATKGGRRVITSDHENVQLEREFRDRSLQTIVKVVSVELTPEKAEM